MKTPQTADFNRFQIHLPPECVVDCSHSGSCDADVDFWVHQIDWSGIEVDDIRAKLSEYGAWDEEELSDDDQNYRRILWIAACNIKEEETQTRFSA